MILSWQPWDRRALKQKTVHLYTSIIQCSKYSPNKSTNIQQYCTVICTVENLSDKPVEVDTAWCPVGEENKMGGHFCKTVTLSFLH